LDGQTKDVLVDWIAHEYRIPKFLARRAYRHVLRLVAASNRLKPGPSDSPTCVPDDVMVNSGT